MSSVNPTAVGGFVLGGLAVVVAAILFFGGWNGPATNFGSLPKVR